MRNLINLKIAEMVEETDGAIYRGVRDSKCLSPLI